MKDKMTGIELLNRVCAKILSARFLVTLAVIGTLCALVFKCIDLVVATVTDEKMFTLAKEIVMFILGGFISVVTAVVTSYFARNDRWQTENGQTNNGTEGGDK
jgi:Na+/serine symporter